MSGFDLDTKIWRYMSFDKFDDLLNKKSLYFSTADGFDDSWEMYPPKAFLERSFWVGLFEENAAAKKYSADLDKMADDAIGFFSHAYNNKSKEYSFSCWSYEGKDNATLWKGFGNQKEAVAVSTSFDSTTGCVYCYEY